MFTFSPSSLSPFTAAVEQLCQTCTVHVAELHIASTNGAVTWSKALCSVGDVTVGLGTCTPSTIKYVFNDGCASTYIAQQTMSEHTLKQGYLYL